MLVSSPRIILKGLEVWLSGSGLATDAPGDMGWGHGLRSTPKALDLIFSAKTNKQRNKKKKKAKEAKTQTPNLEHRLPLLPLLRRDQLSVCPHPSVA